MKTSIIKKTLIPFAFFLFAQTLNSCKKDEICDNPSLPCQTHEGKNTFGCLIDGVPFVAKTSFSIGGAVPVSGAFDESNRLLQIQGTREDAQENLDKISFQAYISADVGGYSMNVIINEYIGYRDYSGQSCDFYHDIDNNGTVLITFLDESKNIIAGTFSMKLINPACTTSQTLEVTQGRFDFGY